MYLSKKLVPPTKIGVIFTNSLDISVQILRKLSIEKDIKLHNLFITKKLNRVIVVAPLQSKLITNFSSEFIYLLNGNVMSEREIYTTLYYAKLKKMTVFIVFYSKYIIPVYYPCPSYIIEISKTYVKCERLHKYSLYVQHIYERRKKISFGG